MSDALSYSHYCEIIWLDIKEIKYYVEISLKNNLTVRQLRTKVKNNEYIRLSEETREKIKIESKLEVDDLIPNPILIKNKNNKRNINRFPEDFYFQLTDEETKKIVVPKWNRK